MRQQWHWEPTGELLEASSTLFQLSFLATVPALGMAVYFVDHDPTDATHQAAPAELTAYESCQNGQRKSQMRGARPVVSYQQLSAAVLLENEEVSVELAAGNGLPSKMTRKRDGSSVQINQKFMMYQTQRSGAYIFRANQDAVFIQASCTTIGVSIGTVTQDALVKVSGGIGLKVSLDQKQSHLDLDISATPGQNQEIITRFNTNVQNSQGTFLVDNGVRMVPRHRMPSVSTWIYTV